MLRAHLRNGLILSLIWGLSPSHANEVQCTTNGNAVVVFDYSMGCFHHEERCTKWILEGDEYVSSLGRIPKSYIEGLYELVLASHVDTSHVLQEVGFTEVEIDSRKLDIYRVVREWYPHLPEEILEWAKPLISYDQAYEAAFNELAGPPPESTTHVEFAVTFLGQKPLTVKSKAQRYWMLPWIVSAEGETWETYSLLIPRALSVLCDATGPNANLLDGSEYWSSELWHDQTFWGSNIGRKLDEVHCKHLYEPLNGFAKATSMFSIASAETGSINSVPYSLELRLRAFESRLVDSIHWWNPLIDERPNSDWNELLAIYENCTKAAEPHAWLDAWKRSAPNRRVSLDVVGSVGYSESNIGFEVEPTWKAVGLLGVPEFELLLHDDGKYHSRLFLGSAETRALVMRSIKGQSGHWLDQQTVDSPDCWVVSPRGDIQKLRVVTNPDR